MSAATAWAPQGALTMKNAGEHLATARTEALAAGRIDLSALTEADSAALAVLVEVVRAARAGGRALEIVGMPAGLRALAELYDLSELLVPNCAAQ